MRRMYSEQELTKIIGEVFDQKIEAGAFNESIADAVDAYLLEHPVDITALEGLDISVGSLTSTGAISGASGSISGNASVGGNLSVTGDASIFEKIIDANSHKRFIEGNMATELTSFTLTYGKWSLSGTHLMLVLAGNIPEGAIFSANDIIGASVGLPSWILDKIYPIKSTIVSFGTFKTINNDWSQTDFNASLIKRVSGLTLEMSEAKTFAKAGTFRMQFDLLIDNAS